MNVIRNSAKVEQGKWARYAYNLTTGIGEEGKRLTGCKEHIDLSLKTAAEGMVLLENDGILPLKKGGKISIFGIGSINYVKGGGGSGYVFPEYVRNIYDGFAANQSVSVYKPVSKFYYDYLCENIESSEKSLHSDITFGELEVPEALMKDAAENSDTAIIVIHRSSGEGSDRSQEKGDFLLTDEEQRLIRNVTENFDKVVAVLNVGAMIDVSWVKDNKKIGACLLAWQAGMEGGTAIADILCGNVNPSGKLVDTVARSFSDYPSSDTFNESDDYVSYYEDIFVGYRYFETIPGVNKNVVYPFGFGLSYTKFDISKPVAIQNGEEIEISVTVKNVGEYAGKEVVQCYFSAPQGKLTKSSISLIAFQKTYLLQSGESQKITLSFNINDMASYDDLGKWQKSAYVLEGGEYKFFVGNSSRELIAADYTYSVKQDFIVARHLSELCAPTKLEKRMLSDGSYELLPSFKIPEFNVENKGNTAKVIESEKPIPLKSVAEGTVSLDEFMTQLTNDELVSLVGGIGSRGTSNTCGFGGIGRLGIPAIMTADGPAGVRLNPKIGIPTTAWPCATLIACTWNPNLMYDIGKAGAIECKENGLAVWLTPALNIHRSPLCGRNFEYFSEDPLISGVFAAAKVRGIQSQNISCAVKHFACNNKEKNRFYYDSRVSERALREIYLKGFEICVKEADPWMIMTSYNIINERRSCESYELLHGILRDEWGYNGMVTTDWGVPCSHCNCVIAGNDVRMPCGKKEELREGLEKGTIKRADLEVCVRKLLEMMLKLD